MVFSSACVEKTECFSHELFTLPLLLHSVHDTRLISLCLLLSPIKYNKMAPLMSLVCREFPETASVLTLK